MRYFCILATVLACAGCANIGGVDTYELENRRLDYLETVFLPTAQRCSKDGGFLIFNDHRASSERPERLSYGEMRIAVARGCAGI